MRQLLETTTLLLSVIVGCHSFSVKRHHAVVKPPSLWELHMATTSSSSSKQKKRSLAVEDPNSIRNIALVGHSHSGKTALAEWMLYDEDVLTKVPTSGESALDSDPIEAARHSSVFSHFLRVPHGTKSMLHVTDTPWGDFPSDALAALDGADAAVLVVSAADGVQAGTIHAYQHCQSAGIPVLVALSKMDRPFLQVDQVLEEMEESFGIKPVPIQSYVGHGEDFDGVVPLFSMDESDQLQKHNTASEEAWMELEEAVAMTDDDLLVEYLEESKLETSHVIAGLKQAVIHGKLLPLVYTSAQRDLGVSELMDVMVGVLPSPITMRDEAIRIACENEALKCDVEPGVETGFAARVLHTVMDSFGSLSILRVISNDRSDGDGPFASLPHEVANLRTQEKIKMPSVSTSFNLCGKERTPLAVGAHIIPGDVVAVPKLPESVCTNDILVVPNALTREQEEISMETAANILTPLSRPPQEVALMTAATVEVKEGGKSKGKGGKSGGSADDKLVNALCAVTREDLAVHVEHDSASGKLLLHCMSQDHLQLLALRLKDRYGLDVEFGDPPVQYRETLKKAVKNIEGKHKKQSGGSGQFGVCFIDMEPLEAGTGIEFESKIKGGVISKPFIASVERGVREQLKEGGPVGGYPVTDVRVTLVDGKMHSVDSKDIAFQMAGKQAVKAALLKGGCKLLQPMEEVTFTTSEGLQGEITTIVARHEGYITGSSPSEDGFNMEIQAVLPGAAIGDVSDVLRAATAGEAQFKSAFSHYQPVPDDLLKNIIGETDTELHP